MEQFYSPDTTKKILLTADHSRLFAHHFHNEQFLRSSLLCSNYKCGLACTLYNDALYYAYINKELTLLLRCVGESSLQFRLDGTKAISYHTPKLVVFGGVLLLIYFECADGMYRLKLRAPFAALPPISAPPALPAPFSELPDLRILTSENHLYLLLSACASSFLFRYSSTFEPEVLGSEEELLTRFRIPWETEKTELEKQLRQIVQQSEAQQAILAEKEAKLRAQEILLTEKATGLQAAEALLVEKDTDLRATKALLSEKTTELSDTKSRLQQSEETLYRVQKQLTECETARREALQARTHTANLLERAKIQYEELMQIALQYKEEAAKWYGKFTDRH